MARIEQCALCGKKPDLHAQQKETITENIEGVNYTFDSKDCMLMFKKFKSVYGNSLFS